MRIMLDTNVLTRLANPALPEQHESAEAAVESLRTNHHVPVLVPQSLYEFWAVATRPLDVNGLGMSPVDARDEVDAMLTLFPLLQDERAIFSRWLDLVTVHGVSGKTSHDARLVAAMLRHNLSWLLTFNVSDFARYTEIAAVHPNEVLAGTAPLTAPKESAGQ